MSIGGIQQQAREDDTYLSRDTFISVARSGMDAESTSCPTTIPRGWDQECQDLGGTNLQLPRLGSRLGFGFGVGQSNNISR